MSDRRSLRVRVDEKGRVTIPQYVREALAIVPGMFVELHVDASTRTIVLKPAASGTVAEYRVRLEDRKNLIDVVSVVVEEGSEVRSLRCGEFECDVEVFIADAVLAERLAEKMRERGIGVVEYRTR
ncbi:MAG: hypothetical protein RMH84_00965 [Sulfolobales archaeon]|nr:hypothetical protein [Sulfolobales archaeon]MCX8208717.1 hypothetical protein [Sulfolobales archaeon]MDW8010156.1 hypothetical protein [Sulfolobales archaeon]